MVHGLLCGKEVAPDLFCALFLGINAKNDIIPNHSRFYLYPPTNTKYSHPPTDLVCFKGISGIQWEADKSISKRKWHAQSVISGKT